MQSGELVVVGQKQVKIQLKKFPSRVTAHFKDDHCPPPCDTGSVDTLEFEVHATHTGHSISGYALVIKWSVSSVREIVWHAYY